MPGPENPDVAWAIADIRANLVPRQKALDYYLGNHVLNFATNKYRNTFSQQFQELADNLCDDVVNTPADRTQIDNWTGTASERAQEWWERNRGPARSGQTHLNAYRSGDAFVIVWDTLADPGKPKPFVQDPRQMAVRYSASDPDVMEVAAKCWREGKGYRLNLYYGPEADPRDRTGRVEHYYSKGTSTGSGDRGIPQAAAFLPLVRGAEGDASFVDWYEPHDHERNPVFHFPNGDLGEYGTSQLSDVYPLQDALNKLLADFMVGCEDVALPKRFGTGVEVIVDPSTGKEMTPWEDGKNFWWTKKGSNEGAGMTQFPAPEMGKLLDAMREMKLSIARKGGLPFYTVDVSAAGSAPSGLSLLISEGKGLKLVRDRHRDWGVVWRELVAFALTWEGAPVTPSDLDAEWAPPETRDEKSLLEMLVLKKAALGAVVPDAQLAREAGYTDKELLEFGAEKEEETAKKLDAAQAAMGGRISPPGPGTPALAPPPPQAPGGAREPVPAGGRA